MDDETAILALELQLADTLDLLAAGKGKTVEPTDTERALQLQAEELQATLTSYTDRRVSQSTSRAIQDDTPALASEDAAGVRDERDRAIAADLDGGRTRRDSETPSTSAPDVSSAIVRDLSKLNIHNANGTCSLIGDDADTTNAGEGSSRHVTHECVACSDSFPAHQVYIAPCNHVYCTDCTIKLFEDSLKDESLFPPRCCRQEMVISSARTILGPAFTERFDLKAIEHATPDKTYCHNRECSRFIHPYDIDGDRGGCTECHAVTCVHCKQKAHIGDCEEVSDDAAFQALTEKQGWHSCFRCHAVVELHTGCNHITCRCRAEFCYVCGLQWRTCQCPQWDEDRLFRAAEVIVERAPPQFDAQPWRDRYYNPDVYDFMDPRRLAEMRRRQQQEAVREAARQHREAVQRAAQQLMERHECEHPRWRHVTGPHQCEECRRHLPRFINECQQCHLQACWRCRNNRL